MSNARRGIREPSSRFQLEDFQLEYWRPTTTLQSVPPLGDCTGVEGQYWGKRRLAENLGFRNGLADGERVSNRTGGDSARLCKAPTGASSRHLPSLRPSRADPHSSPTGERFRHIGGGERFRHIGGGVPFRATLDQRTHTDDQ